MAYKHGAYANLTDDAVERVSSASLALVAVGTAPVHLTGLNRWDSGYADAVNTPVKITDFASAKKLLGYSALASEWEKYSLLEVIKRCFNSGAANIGPVYFINVFNPAVHHGAIQNGHITFKNGTVTFDDPDMIVDSVNIAGYAAGSDFIVTASENGTVTVRDLTEAGIPAGTAFSFYKADPTAVTKADIIGYVDQYERTFGLKAIKQVYTKYNAYPQFLIAPGWSDDADVYSAMLEDGYKVNGHWYAHTVADLPLDFEAFDPVAYDTYMDPSNGLSVIEWNLDNHNIDPDTLDVSSVKVYKGATAQTATVDAEAVNDESTAAVGYFGSNIAFTAADLGSPETLGYRLAFTFDSDAATDAFCLYKGGVADAPADFEKVWGSGSAAATYAGVKAAYEADVEAQVIDNLIVFSETYTDWSGASDVDTKTLLIDGVSAGHVIKATLSSGSAGVYKLVFSATPVTIDTRQKAILFKPTSVWTDERSDVCFPQAKDAKGYVYHLSTLQGAEYLRLAAENNNIPYQTPSNKPVPVTAQFFGKNALTAQFDFEDANQLNEKGIVTIAQNNGEWVLWGNSTAAFEYGGTYPQRSRFNSNMVLLEFVRNFFQTKYGVYVDSVMPLSLIQTILTRFREDLDGMGEAFLDVNVDFVESANPVTELMEGNFTFTMKGTPTPVANTLNLEVTYTTEGFAKYFEEAS